MHKKWILFLIIVFLMPAQGLPERFRVCSITVNSSDEMNIFVKNLDSSRFDFVEFVPPVHEVEKYDGGRWFSHVCSSSRVSCDVLVISGHFAGMFLGTDNDYILSMSELEQMACQKNCSHIFENLKEVYLFGCNTMASKTNSSRTPEEYLDILVNRYEMAGDLAETVVASRFSIIGPAFKTQMEHIFSEKTKIYGFPDLSPLGKQARPLTQRYFDGINKEYGNYYNYLIQTFYKNSNNTTKPYFKSAFSAVSPVSLSTGMGPSHPHKKTYEKICSLHSNQKSVQSKLKIVKNLFEEDEGFFAFPTVKTFLIDSMDRFSPENQKLFQELQSMSDVKDKFLKAYLEMNPRLVYIRSQIMHFLYTLSWVSESAYQAQLKQMLFPMVQKHTPQSFDILNALVAQDKINPSDISIGYNDLGKDYLKNIWSVLLVDTLRISSVQMQTDLMNYCLREIKKDIVLCYQILKTLGHITANDPLVLQAMKDFLTHSDPGLVYYATYGLAYSRVDEPYTHFEIFKNLYHPEAWIRLQSLKTLDYLDLIQKGSLVEKGIRDRLSKENDPKVIQEIQSILQRNIRMTSR